MFCLLGFVLVFSPLPSLSIRLFQVRTFGFQTESDFSVRYTFCNIRIQEFSQKQQEVQVKKGYAHSSMGIALTADKLTQREKKTVRSIVLLDMQEGALPAIVQPYNEDFILHFGHHQAMNCWRRRQPPSLRFWQWVKATSPRCKPNSPMEKGSKQKK